MATPDHGHHAHHYSVHCLWTGSTGDGYEAYSRAHTAEAPPASIGLELSSDPTFRGDATRLNPEQLVVVAAASCQLLSFLAVAARARVEVVRYEDAGEGTMRDDDPPVRLAVIVLRPTIWVVGTNEAQVLHLVEVAHRECYVANSLRSEVRVEPTVIMVSRPAGTHESIPGAPVPMRPSGGTRPGASPPRGTST